MEGAAVLALKDNSVAVGRFVHRRLQVAAGKHDNALCCCRACQPPRDEQSAQAR
jgi:hypothetical protein